MDQSQIQLLDLINRGSIEAVLKQDNLNSNLNYLIENQMIDIQEEEILVTESGYEVLKQKNLMN